MVKRPRSDPLLIEPAGGVMGGNSVVMSVRESLAAVLDPCSVHNGTRLSFVDLGMVESVTLVSPGRIQVRLLLDDPVCLYLVDIIRSVSEAALSVDQVNQVDVEIVGDGMWSPDLISAEAKEKMAGWREARRVRLGMPTVRRSTGVPALVTPIAK
jgi:metal-sulfur cluster biosynthetic enzyme